jgi:hypothetical protein
MKYRGILILSYLLPATATAAILQSAQLAPARNSVREVPVDTRKPKPDPIPAPAPTNHYARPAALPPAWKI